jgi:hypothetical protein
MVCKDAPHTLSDQDAGGHAEVPSFLSLNNLLRTAERTNAAEEVKLSLRMIAERCCQDADDRATSWRLSCERRQPRPGA